MNDWFTVEKIDAGTYALSEYRHKEETHSYLLLSGGEGILIDTGMGVENIREVADRLGGADLRILTTHVHWDHIGSHGSFSSFGVHPAELEWISGRFPLPEAAVRASLLGGSDDFPPDFDIHAYRVFRGSPSFLQEDGMTVCFGSRRLRVIHTPGHSPGHCVFYEPDSRYLFSGDLLYKGQIDAYYETTDPASLLSSYAKLLPLDIGRILPGHHSLDCSPAMVNEAYEALAALERRSLLHHGSGIFSCGSFSFRF